MTLTDEHKNEKKKPFGKGDREDSLSRTAFQHLIYILQEDIFLQREREPDRYPEGFCEILSD